MKLKKGDSQCQKHDEQRTSTFRGIVIDSRAEPENAPELIHFSRESLSNAIDESDRQFEKHDEQRISILKGIVISSSQPKYPINLECDESRTNDESITKCEFSASIEIKIYEIFENAEPWIKSISRGIVIDLRAE
jgi:hypothetical protein